MSEFVGLTKSELLSSYGNSEAADRVLLMAVKELPSAASALAREAYNDPLGTAWHVTKTAGSGLVFGAALGYIIPGRGPTAAILAAAFTAPAISGAYQRVNQARLDATRSNANLEAIAHQLARDTVSGTADFAVGMAGGLAGARLGREIAMSDTGAGRFAQSAQRLVLSAENKVMNQARSLFSGRQSAGQAQDMTVDFRDPNTQFERLDSMSWAKRQQSLLNYRLDQYTAADPQMKMHYGSLHGHSVYSDGMGKPAEIYARAKEIGLDFTAITDHSHKAARGGVKPGDPRYPGQQKVPTVAENPAYYVETINAANEATVPGKFVGIYGVEMGTIGKVGSKGQSGVNHINVFQTDTFFETVKPPRQSFLAEQTPKVEKIIDGDYKALVNHLDKIKDATGGRPVVQLNHPRFTADQSPDIPAKYRGRDYGQKSFKSNAEWVDRFGKYASQMEIINGEAIKKTLQGDFSAASRTHDVDFAGYIDKGLRLSPTFGRDFHYGDPGGTKAATGIMSRSLDQKSIMDALRARRTIATTNAENLSGSMMANDVHPMGSVLDQRAVPDLNLKLNVGGKISPDAEYKAMLWGDAKVGDGKLAKVIQTKTLTGQELLGANKVISFDTVKQTLGAKGAYWVELQRIPPAGESPALAAAFERSLPFSQIAKSSLPIFRHVPEAGTLDPHSLFLGDRMWTAPIWSEPLGGKDHSLLVRSLIGIGSTFVGN